MEDYFKRLAEGPPFSENEDMKYEFRRLLSFQNWPMLSPAYPLCLAKAGFFYNGNEDEVTCFKCGVKKSEWTLLDSPCIIHRNLNPDCPFLVDNDENDNVPVVLSTDCLARNDLAPILVLGTRLDTILNNENLSAVGAVDAVGSECLADDATVPLDVVPNTADENKSTPQNEQDDAIASTSDNAGQSSLNDQQSIQRSRSLGNLQTNFRQTAPANVCIDERASTFPDTKPSRNEASNVADSTSTLDITQNGLIQFSRGTDRGRSSGAKPKEDKKKAKHSKKSKDKKSGKSKPADNRGSSSGSTSGGQSGYDIPPPSGELIGPLRFERNRLETFNTWPSNACVPANELAKCGFFYTGSGDRVQCIFCKGILRNWEEGDRPHIEHRKHFPRCPLVLGMRIGNVPLPVNQNQSSAIFNGASNPTSRMQSDPANQNVSDTFQMENLGIVTDRPKHAQFAIEAQRVASFKGWPQYKHQTIQQLAEAGFWYAGFNDNVKCFYCDGGLRNWEEGDVPWEEHARWFPKCPYVLQVKGQEFINGILHAKGGDAAVLANAQRSSGEFTEERQQSGRYNVEEREIRARMDSPYIKKVLDMGISQEIIMTTIRKRLHETGDDFPSATALMEAVFKEEANASSQNTPNSQNTPTSQAGSATSQAGSARSQAGSVTSQAGSATSQTGSATSNAGSISSATKNEPSPDINQSKCNIKPTSSELNSTEENKEKDEEMEEKDRTAGCSGTSVQADDLMKENIELKEQRLCKICMVSDANVVFLPCGHLVSCASCAPALQMCPICRATIKGTVRTYIA